MWDILENDVFDSIKRWEPKKKFPHETDYRDDLILFFRDDLNRGSSFGYNSTKARIMPESGRHLCDIGINNKIGIELKKDFNTISKSDRLIGQITRFLEQYDKIFIVTVGETNPNTLDHLKHQIKKIDNSQSFGFIQKQNIIIMDKGSTNRKNKIRNALDNEGDPLAIRGLVNPSFKF